MYYIISIVRICNIMHEFPASLLCQISSPLTLLLITYTNTWERTKWSPQLPYSQRTMQYHGIMGRRFPDGGLLRYRKWVRQQLGDVNKQMSGDSQPIGARHGDTAASHTDLQSWCGRTCVFAVQVWSNLWDLIWLRTSHYSMIRPLTWWMSLLSSQGQF